MRTYDSVYLAVRDAKSYEEFEEQWSHIKDLDSSAPYIYVVEQFAFEGNEVFVGYCIKKAFRTEEKLKETFGSHVTTDKKGTFNAIARGYARAGYEKYTDKADPIEIAQGFALGGHYTLVDNYINRGLITGEDAVICFIKARNNEKVEEYYQKYKSIINLERLVYTCAAEGNDTQLEKWLDPQNAPAAAKGYASVGADQQIRALQKKYHVLLEITDYPEQMYGLRYDDEKKLRQERIDRLVYYFALNNKDKDVRRYLEEYSADTRMAAEGYRDSGQSEKIKDLPEQKKIDLNTRFDNETWDLLREIRGLIESRLEQCSKNKKPWDLGFFGSSYFITRNDKVFFVPESISKIYTEVQESNLRELGFDERRLLSKQILAIASSKTRTKTHSFWGEVLAMIKVFLGMECTKDTRNFHKGVEYICEFGRSPTLGPR